MITHRSTKKVKPDCLEEFKALVLAEARAARPKHGFRIYTSRIGPQQDVLAMEIDFDDFAEYEQFWHNWSTGPTVAAFTEQYRQLVDHAIADDIWTMAGQKKG